MDSDGANDAPSRLPARAKSSLRKGRSANVQHVARRPRQDRSQQRFDQILDATEELLEEMNIEDISAYDVGRKAKMAASSITYLFPTMAALRIELNRRYSRITTDNVMAAHRNLARHRNPNWQHWLQAMGRSYMNDCNSHRYFAEVVLGPWINRDSKRFALQMNGEIAQSFVASLSEVFIVPEIPDLEWHIGLSIEVVDAVFCSAYMATGRIDEDAFEEAMKMQAAYLRLYLPEKMYLRDIEPDA